MSAFDRENALIKRQATYLKCFAGPEQREIAVVVQKAVRLLKSLYKRAPRSYEAAIRVLGTEIALFEKDRVL